MAVYEERKVKAVEETIRSRYCGGGVGVSGSRETEFEKKFSGSYGCKYDICIANETAALHVALLAASIGPGDEVIVPELTFWATGGAVLMTGALPVIVDVDPETYCMDAAAVEDAITNRTKALLIWRDKPAGSIGDMGCFSFQQGKFMTFWGGGIIITNNMR